VSKAKSRMAGLKSKDLKNRQFKLQDDPIPDVVFFQEDIFVALYFFSKP
jgi:hypothetical protein